MKAQGHFSWAGVSPLFVLVERPIAQSNSRNWRKIFSWTLVLFAILAVGNVQPARCQGGTHSWSKHYGSTNVDWAQAVAVDSNGNVIATGCFSGTVDFGGGPLTSAGQCDIFVVKFSGTDGAHLWSKGFGGAASDYGYAVAADGSGDVFVTGRFENTVNFGGGPLTSAGWADIFVVKLSGTDGTHLWSKAFAGVSDDDWGRGLAVDSQGNVVVTGMIRNSSVDFGGGPVSGLGGSDIFVAKFSGTNGAHLWSKGFGGALNDFGYGVAVDRSDDVFLSGGFAGTVDFGGGPLTGPGGYDIYVVKLSGASGAHVWSKQFGGVPIDYGFAIAVDGSGNAIVTGTFNGTVDFGGGPLTSAGSSGGLAGDIFVAKLAPDGSHLWSKRFGSTGGDVGNFVTVDSGGNVLVTGYFQGAVDFGGGALTSAGKNDIFLTKLSSVDGSHLWSRSFGSTEDDFGYGLAVDGVDNVLLAGSFKITVDFGGGPFTSQGDADIIVAKFIGNVSGPAASLAPSNLDFGNQLVSTTSAARSITLTNSGTATLNISGISLTGADSAEFAQTNNCGATLAAGSNCKIDVTFSPASTGAKTASVSVASDASGSPHSVALTGTGTVPAPAVTLAPAVLNFADQLINSTSAAQTVTLTNSGTAMLNITAISLSGADSNQFALANNCGNTLAVSASCAMSVTFGPTTVGAKSATISITSDAAGSPHAAPLSGNGITPPAVSLSAGSVTFAAQIANTTSAAQTITLTNTGGSVLNIVSLSVTGADAAEFTKTDNCGASLNAGASCTINVTFRPDSTGSCSAAVTIQHNAAGGPHTVSLVGLGTDFSVAAASGSSATATINAGQSAAYQLSFAGTAGFNGTVTLSCSGAPTASTCTVSPASLTLSGITPVTASVTLSTTSRSWLLPLRMPRAPFLLPVLLALLLMTWLCATRKRQPRFARILLSTATLMSVLFIANCGGGGGSGSPPLPRGTPAGTFSITVTASMQQGTQTVNRIMNLTVVVQ